MAEPISVCTKEEQRGVIRFLWSEGVTGAEIHRRLSAQYGNRALPQRSVYEWIEKFQHGRTNVKDEERAGRPSTSIIDSNVEDARAMILENRRVTIDELANHFEISNGSAYDIIHNRLVFRKVCARWVPKQLTEEQKNNRVAICQRQLDRYAKEGEAFLTRIVNGDETWVHHFAPESKRQSMEWKHPGSPVKKKFKGQTFARKVMLSIFWDSQGILLEHYLERGTTVNSVGCSEMQSTELKPEIRTKRRGLLSSGVLLLHDNASPHTAIHTLQTLEKLDLTVLEHPAYSPDFALSDYHLFSPLKCALRGRRFTSDEGVKEAVHEWLAAQAKTFFSEGIQKLLERWNKCIAKHGDYIEKMI